MLTKIRGMRGDIVWLENTMNYPVLAIEEVHEAEKPWNAYGVFIPPTQVEMSRTSERQSEKQRAR